MKRLLSAVVLLLGATAPAWGHFVFIVPADAGRKAEVVFSDEPRPDKPELLAKIAQTRFRVFQNGKETPMQAAKGKDALQLAVPGKDPAWVVGVCPYGVSTRGKEPFLLNYYARALVGVKTGAGNELLEQHFKVLKLDVVPQVEKKSGERPAVRVLWEGKPLAEADVVLYVPGKDKPVEKKTDKDGLATLEEQTQTGVYAVRAAHTQKTKGSLDGKDYAAVRSYCTLTFRVPEPPRRAAKSEVLFRAVEAKKPVADPQAMKLLASAIAERATWASFPGFRAGVTVNTDGKAVQGVVEVSKSGKVHLKLDGDEQLWAKNMLASIVGHRMDGPAAENRCYFPDDVTDHPLGRAVKLVNDQFHSSYRVRDNQVIEVNRVMGSLRFTITVMENHLNAEKKYLPVSYVVNYWDVKSGALKRSATHHNTWTRVGKFDLPLTATVVTAEEGKQTTRSIKLSDIELNKQ